MSRPWIDKPLLCVLSLSACSSDSCVAAGSLVDTPRGRVAIETLRVGDVIWSIDPVRQTRVHATVTAIRSARRDCVQIGIAGERPLTLTHDHPVYSPAHKSYGDARHWVRGEVRVLLAVSESEIYETPAVSIRHHVGEREVFDLTVDHHLHNFVANGIVVHNKSETGAGTDPSESLSASESNSEADATTSDGSSDSSSDAETTGDGDGDGDATTTSSTSSGDGDGDGDPNECLNWQSEHPDWIFCDDFESEDPLVGDGRYFEAASEDVGFTLENDLGYLGSAAVQGHWQVGQVGAGGLKLGFGRNPNGYMNKGIRPDEDFREVYYRIMLKHEAGWVGSPAKLSRATVFSSADDWSQAMIAHLWSDDAEHLLIDPASCVEGSTVQCVGYNDFNALNWLGNQAGPTEIFATDASDQWYCVEAHVKLNDPGEANGEQEFWIDGQLEVSSQSLDFVQDYTAYAINAVFLENYWNEGSGQEQKRWMDNFVVSTAPIGCPGD